MTLRVLHVVRTLDPKTGGPPAVAISLAAAERSLGHDTAVLTYTGAGPDHRERWAHVPGSDRVQVRPVRKTAGARVLAGAAPDAETVDAVRWADVVHLHGVWDLALAHAAAAARRTRTPYVVTPHGMLEPWSLAQKRWKKQVALRLHYRRMLSRAAAIHWLNDSEREVSTRRLPLRTEHRVIANGVFLDEPVDPPSRDLVTGAAPSLGDAPYALFLGRLHHKKGLDILAAAFARVAGGAFGPDPGTHLVVVGPDEGARAAFEEAIATSGLTARVHLPGPLYGDAKRAALAHAAAFVLPSRQEGFSVAVLEAMASRCPVVISEACHFPEVEAVGAGRVTPLSPDDVGAALHAVVSDPASRRTLGDAGRQLIERSYTWERVATAMCALYTEVTQPTR